MKHLTTTVAVLAVLASATAANAHGRWSNAKHDRAENTRFTDNTQARYTGCRRMIDNSASANMAHKGGVNTRMAPNDVTFDNCSPLTDGFIGREYDRNDRRFSKNKRWKNDTYSARRGNMATRDAYEYPNDVDRGDNYRGY